MTFCGLSIQIIITNKRTKGKRESKTERERETQRDMCIFIDTGKENGEKGRKIKGRKNY